MEVQTKLNTLPAAQLDRLEGMFYRVQDFTESHANLNQLFSDEYRVALDILPKSKTADELHSNIAKLKIRPWTTGKNHFTTYNMAPTLRHFLNDSCRLIEPTKHLLFSKFSDIGARRNESVDTYVKKLVEADKTLVFDADYIIQLYELWNDYKHRRTQGLHTTAWKFESSKIVKPALALPPLNIEVTKLNNLEVDKFVNLTTEKILEYLNFII